MPTHPNALLMEKLIQDFSDKTNNYKIETCTLGSCQYGTIELTYNFILAALKLDRALFEKLFQVTYTSQDTLSEFLAALQSICSEAYNEDPEDKEEPIINSIADYYAWTRDNAWDLWSASANPFTNFTISPLELPTFGPKLNQLCQDENWNTGVDLAYTSFIFGTDITTFADFDT